MHPLAVLLPTGLLLAAMIVVFLGLVCPAHRRAASVAAICILVVGAMATIASQQTGRSSAHRFEQTIPQNKIEQIEELLAEHIRHARAAVMMYYLSGFLCTTIFLLPLVWKRLAQRRVLLAADFILLVWLAATGYALAHSADSGIRLARRHWSIAAKADPWAEAAAELAPPVDQRR